LINPHRLWFRLFGALGLCWVVLGCAGGRGYDQVQVGLADPRTSIQGLQPFEQSPGQCGAAALATLLDWTGLEVSPQSLGPLVYDPQLQGSLQASMKAAARRHGRLAYEIQGRDELLHEVAAGHPVIVLQNLGLSWHPVHHYAVVFGFDLNQGSVFLLSGQTSPEVEDVGVFDATWSRAGSWGLLVLRPEEPPARPGKSRYIKAILGLEQAGRTQAAARGYEAYLSLWPEDQSAMLGLANCAYLSGDLHRAADVLFRAVEVHPASAALQNNLAHVLKELGQLDRALTAAQRAVALEGPNLDIALRTLEEIERLKDLGRGHQTGSCPQPWTEQESRPGFQHGCPKD